jgi:glycyl-tRNA synthetase beta chain
VLIADQLDKLFGYLGLGLAPSGSSDPFALRRAAHILIETALRWPGEFFNYLSLWDEVAEYYTRSGVNAALDTAKSASLLQEVFESRYQVVLHDVRYDLLEAALDGGGHPISAHPQGIRFRVICLTKLAEDPKLVQCLTRPLNLVRAAAAKGLTLETDDPGKGSLESPEGDTLRDAVAAALPGISKAMGAKDADAYVAGLASLQEPINAFFDSTMIMVDDVAVRSTRLELLGQISECLSWCGDLNRIVLE